MKGMVIHMYIGNKTLADDVEYLNKIAYIPWNRLKNTVLLITGATGLIGYNLIYGLLYVSERKNLNIKIIALVRDMEKANKKFARMLKGNGLLTFIEGDVEHFPSIERHIDYIIHGASPTASGYFIEYPVETIATAITGTMNMLKFASDKQVRGFVYLSSMEVYGEIKTEAMLDEKSVGYMNPLIVRNSYSESKRMCETMIAAYVNEYHVPAMSIRLAQTFGAGVQKDDTRVFAEFARCAVTGHDIVLLTDGSSKRCYLYTMDAVSAILTVLLKGEAGKAYNAGNPDTYCSIKEMADMAAVQIAHSRIKVIIAKDPERSKKFSPPHFYRLDIKELERLGWRADKGLIHMYKAMIEGWQNESRD